MNLGTAIRTVRAAKGVRQRELARKLDVTPNYLSLLEHNKREPSISFLKRLASELSVPVSIFFAQDDMPAGPAERAELGEIRSMLVRLEAMYLAGTRRTRSGQ